MNSMDAEKYSMADVEQLVKTLYHPGLPEVITDTEKNLRGLQRSPNGWQIADALLQSEDANVRFFGALTFTIKANQDWHEWLHLTMIQKLTADTIALLYRLVGWLIRLIKAGESALVLKKLCSALVAYYLRPSSTLDQCVLHLIVSFREGFPCQLEQLGTVSPLDWSTIHALNELQAKTIMWFASGIVEEVSKANGASIQTYRYFERVSSNTENIASLLRRALSSTSFEDLTLTAEGVKCFQSWVMYAHRSCVDGRSDLKLLRPLTPLAITALQHEQIYDEVTELFTDIFNHSPAFLTDDNVGTLTTFLSNYDARNKVSRVKAGDIDEDAMSFAKLLLACGDATVQNLAQQPDNPQLNQISFQLLELLKCNGYGGVEDDICSQALEFWTNFTELVIDSLYESDTDRPSWIEVARQRIEAVIEACWVRIRMPSHEVAVTWDSETRSSFKIFRQDVQDLLQSSFRLLGLDLLKSLARLSLQSINERAWLPLEATLFCLNGLADCVSDDDTIDDILSQSVFNSTLFADMAVATHEIPAKTRQTAVSMVSSYTAFFERRSEHLPGILNFLFESLKFPALCHVAAKAILAACSSCCAKLTSEIDVFLHQLETIETWDHIDVSVKERLIGAIAAIIKAVPKEEDKVAHLSRLIDCTERDVELCVKAVEVSSDESTKRGISALKCLVSMGKALQTPDDTVIDLDVQNPPSKFWTEGQGALLQFRIIRILDTLTISLKGNGEAIEAACQVLRIGYKERTPGLFVFPLQITVNFALASNLETARVDCVLDTVGICFSSGAREAEDIMINAASTILNHLGGFIQSMNHDPSTDPEASTSAIGIVERMIPRYLSCLLKSNDTQTLLDFILRALTVPDLMPKRAAAQFWATFMRRHEVSEEIADLLRITTSRYGPPLCQILVRKIAGEASRSELDSLAEPLKKTVFNQPPAKLWLSEALNADTFPSQKVGPLEKRMWLHKIMNLRGSKGTNQAIKDFWIQCRGPEFTYTQ
ncbi:member of the karyopherin-beta [Lecanora helva]